MIQVSTLTETAAALTRENIQLRNQMPEHAAAQRVAVEQENSAADTSQVREPTSLLSTTSSGLGGDEQNLRLELAMTNAEADKMRLDLDARTKALLFWHNRATGDVASADERSVQRLVLVASGQSSEASGPGLAARPVPPRQLPAPALRSAAFAVQAPAPTWPPVVPASPSAPPAAQSWAHFNSARSNSAGDSAPPLARAPVPASSESGGEWANFRDSMDADGQPMPAAAAAAAAASAPAQASPAGNGAAAVDPSLGLGQQHVTIMVTIGSAQKSAGDGGGSGGGDDDSGSSPRPLLRAAGSVALVSSADLATARKAITARMAALGGNIQTLPAAEAAAVVALTPHWVFVAHGAPIGLKAESRWRVDAAVHQPGSPGGRPWLVLRPKAAPAAVAPVGKPLEAKARRVTVTLVSDEDHSPDQSLRGAGGRRRSLSAAGSILGEVVLPAAASDGPFAGCTAQQMSPTVYRSVHASYLCLSPVVSDASGMPNFDRPAAAVRIAGRLCVRPWRRPGLAQAGGAMERDLGSGRPATGFHPGEPQPAAVDGPERTD